jgi:hypothetical protein
MKEPPPIELTEFQPWMNPVTGEEKIEHISLSRRVLRLFSSRSWDTAYVLLFVLWTLAKGVTEFVDVMEPWVDYSLGGMCLVVLVPFTAAVLFRILNAELLNATPRQEVRFWVSEGGGGGDDGDDGDYDDDHHPTW